MYVAWLYVRCLSAQCPLRGASAHNPYIGGSAGTRHRSKMVNRPRRCHPEGPCAWHLRRAFSISFSRRPLADPPWAQESRPLAASASIVTLEKTTRCAAAADESAGEAQGAVPQPHPGLRRRLHRPRHCAKQRHAAVPREARSQWLPWCQRCGESRRERGTGKAGEHITGGKSLPKACATRSAPRRTALNPPRTDFLS